ncbi:MAG: DUF2461 domain-containing protein [Candidatus Kariarchaeaceae archaeon]|jgi:uncharacterized protein (TIGR02453 family)
MPFFSPAFLQFFEELEQDNSKEWFDENRHIYNSEVRDAFKDFAHIVATKLREFDEIIDPSPYIYRINNDLRFQPDKEPYKLHRSASFSPVASAGAPSGYYLQISATDIYLGGGLYDVNTRKKTQVREYMAEHLDEFQKLYKAKDFKKYYAGIEGKKNKRLPPSIKHLGEREPLLFNTQWYYTTSIPAEIVLSDKILDELMDRYRAIHELNLFFRQAYAD